MPDGSRRDPSVEEGFTHVDAQPDASFLVATMDATAQWPAVRRLRAWERSRLAPVAGDRVLDVGCGLGEVAIALSADVGVDGHVLGFDASEAFLTVARERAASVGAATEFRTGDALALDIEDGSVDVCRSERMLQWLPDIDDAVAEMVRVLRPGGRLCITDTDWRTLTLDLPDLALVAAVNRALYEFRGPSCAAGSRLLNIARDLELTDLECRGDMHVWTHWDPDNEDGRMGFFPLDSTIGQLAEHGFLDVEIARNFVDQAYAAARADRYYMSLTMTAVFGRRSS